MTGARFLQSVLLTAVCLIAAAQPAVANRLVKVGVRDQAPLVFEDKGQAKGLFIDVLKYVAADQRWDLQFVPGTLSECLERLERGEIDLLPVLAWSEPREEKFDFSNQFLFLDWGLVFRRKGSRINTVYDLSGKRIAGIEGSIFIKELVSLGEKFGISFSLKLAGDYNEAFSMVSRGEADAAVCGNVAGTLLEDKYDAERTNIIFTPIKIRYAVQDGRYDELLKPLDAIVDRLKEDKGSLYYASYDRWMGFTAEPNLPPWIAWTGIALAAGLAAVGIFAITLRKLVRIRTAELKEALTAQSLSESRFRATFEQAAVGIAHKNMEGNWLMVNQKFCDIVGYSREELLVRNFQEITHPDDLAKDLDNLVELTVGSIPMYSMEKRYIRKDGGLIWVGLTVSIVRGKSGEQDYYISVIQDITERKMVERELENARQYIQNIINSMPSVVIGVDEQGRVTHINQTASALLSHPEGRGVGDPLEQVFPTYAAQMEYIREAIRQRKPLLQEKQPSLADGEVRYQDVLIYPLIADGVQGAVLRIDDVTERVRLAEMMVQTEKMMSVGGLAAGMAHEINNPLGAILQSAQVIQMHIDPDRPINRKAAEESGCAMESIRVFMEKRKVPEFLEGIREAGARAAKIVANMLEFSRRSESHKEPVVLSEVLDKGVQLASSDYDLKKKYDFRQIEIVREYDPDVPPAWCSRTEIEQVVLNLLKNAAQAMSLKQYTDSRPAITLRTARTGDRVAFVVEDNGPGMEESVRKRVFEPFFTTKEPGEGTGLGLSVSYFIVTTNHGGSISVESEPDQGARFTIELPAAGSEGSEL